MIALAMTMSDKPMAVNMSFQREYAERYEWIKQQFEDIAFSYLTSVIFYEDYDMMQPEQCLLMQQGMEALACNARLTESPCWISLPSCGIFIR